MDQEPTDVELIEKHLSGEQTALDELIQRYFRQVFLFAKGYVKQDQEAEDVTQEAFVKVWKNLKKFDREKKFKTWLFQITKNTCIDFLRKSKNQLKSGNGDDEQLADDLEKITDNSPLPEETIDSNSFNQQLEQIISELPENYRATVNLHLQHDLTFQEIAEILNESLNTVKSRYRRALIGIRKKYKKINENAPKSP